MTLRRAAPRANPSQPKSARRVKLRGCEPQPRPRREHGAGAGHARDALSPAHAAGTQTLQPDRSAPCGCEMRSWRRASQLVSSCDSSAESGLVLLHAQQCQPLRGAWVWLSPRAPGSASAAFGEGRIGTRRRTARDGSLHQCSCLRARAVARSRAGCFVGQPRRPASTEHCTLCAAGS